MHGIDFYMMCCFETHGFLDLFPRPVELGYGCFRFWGERLLESGLGSGMGIWGKVNTR